MFIDIRSYNNKRYVLTRINLTMLFFIFKESYRIEKLKNVSSI